jgi:hypothetical protein
MDNPLRAGSSAPVPRVIGYRELANGVESAVTATTRRHPPHRNRRGAALLAAAIDYCSCGVVGMAMAGRMAAELVVRRPWAIKRSSSSYLTIPTRKGPTSWRNATF